MMKHKWYVNEVTDEFCYHDDPKRKVKLKLKLGHLYLEWPEHLLPAPRAELFRIHS